MFQRLLSFLQTTVEACLVIATITMICTALLAVTPLQVLVGGWLFQTLTAGAVILMACGLVAAAATLSHLVLSGLFGPFEWEPKPLYKDNKVSHETVPRPAGSHPFEGTHAD